MSYISREWLLSKLGHYFEKFYGQRYSKSAISQMMQGASKDVYAWLDRIGLDEIYLIVYIDATFWHTRKADSVSKEAFYTILGVKQDTTREVLAVVNHPNEGASNWEDICTSLQSRGVKSVQLVVSDGLTGIEDAIEKVFPRATVQLCTVHRPIPLEA